MLTIASTKCIINAIYHSLPKNNNATHKYNVSVNFLSYKYHWHNILTPSWIATTKLQNSVEQIHRPNKQINNQGSIKSLKVTFECSIITTICITSCNHQTSLSVLSIFSILLNQLMLLCDWNACASSTFVRAAWCMNWCTFVLRPKTFKNIK